MTTSAMRIGRFSRTAVLLFLARWPEADQKVAMSQPHCLEPSACLSTQSRLFRNTVHRCRTCPL